MSLLPSSQFSSRKLDFLHLDQCGTSTEFAYGESIKPLKLISPCPFSYAYLGLCTTSDFRRKSNLFIIPLSSFFKLVVHTNLSVYLCTNNQYLLTILYINKASSSRAHWIMNKTKFLSIHNLGDT